MCLFTPGNARHGRSRRANMQWCPRSVDVFVMDWSTHYFWCFVYENAWIYVLYVCCFQEVYYGYTFFRGYSVKVFKWVLVAVVITKEKLKVCVIRIPM